jgi:hypothetical protein
MRGLACVFVALACCSAEKPRTQSTPAPLPRAPPAPSASTVTVDASAPMDAHVARPSPYAPVAAVLTSPDSVEAFALASHGFADAPPNTPRFLARYPIVKKLARPTQSFVSAFAALVLQLEGELSDKLAALIRASYPSVLAR